MSELINRWFSRAARLPGMLACGLRYADGSAFSRTWELHLQDALLNELWSRLMPIADVASAQSAEILRWTFDKSVVLAASRESGAVFFVLLSKKDADISSAERLLNEFRALRG